MQLKPGANILPVLSGKFRYEALAIRYCLVICHDLTQRHTNPLVMYVHDSLKET